MTITAREWVATTYGAPADALQLREVQLGEPATGEVIIAVHATGLNPIDFKRFADGDPAELPVRIGFEVAGVIAAAGPDTALASGQPATVGEPVVAYRVTGGLATHVTAAASDVYAKPAELDDDQAAGLILAGATAAHMLHLTGTAAGDTVLIHGGSGAVGVSLLQQARALGARAIATASPKRFDVVRGYGGEPVAYGEGLTARVRELAPDGVDVALLAVGTNEAVDTSIALVADRARTVTIVPTPYAQEHEIPFAGGFTPEGIAFRDGIRGPLIQLAAAGELEVPIARTFPFAEAPAALELLRTGHPGGKLVVRT